MIARMQIRKTSWDALAANPSVAPAEVQKLFRLGQVLEIDSVNPVDFTMINVIGSPAEIDALYNYFDPADKQSIWRWNFDGTVDFDTEYAGQHNDILATEPDHVTYDENGNPTGSTPATFENPNWVNAWAGQGDANYLQRHARGYSRGYSKGYS